MPAPQASSLDGSDTQFVQQTLSFRPKSASVPHANASELSGSWSTVDDPDECHEPNIPQYSNVVVQKQPHVEFRGIGEWAPQIHSGSSAPGLGTAFPNTSRPVENRSFGSKIKEFGWRDYVEEWLRQSEGEGAYTFYHLLCEPSNLSLPQQILAGGFGGIDETIGKTPIVKAPVLPHGLRPDQGLPAQQLVDGVSNLAKGEMLVTADEANRGSPSGDNLNNERLSLVDTKSEETKKLVEYPCIFSLVDLDNHARCLVLRKSQPSHLIEHLCQYHGFEKHNTKHYLVETATSDSKGRRGICMRHKCWKVFEDFDELVKHSDDHDSRTSADKSSIPGLNKFFMLCAWFGFRQSKSDYEAYTSWRHPSDATKDDGIRTNNLNAGASPDSGVSFDPSNASQSVKYRKRVGESNEAESPLHKRRQSERGHESEASNSPANAVAGVANDNLPTISVQNAEGNSSASAVSSTLDQEMPVKEYSIDIPSKLSSASLRNDSPRLDNAQLGSHQGAAENRLFPNADVMELYTADNDYDASVHGGTRKTPSS